MSIGTLQIIINVCFIVAVVMAIWMAVNTIKNYDDMAVEDNDWVIDFCAGKPYKKSMK